jgi:hypothetical protein
MFHGLRKRRGKNAVKASLRNAPAQEITHGQGRLGGDNLRQCLVDCHNRQKWAGSSEKPRADQPLGSTSSTSFADWYKSTG